MKTQKIRWLVVVVALLIMVIAAETSMAQAGWTKFRPGSGITLEGYKGDLKHWKQLSFATSVWFISGDFEMAPNYYISFELPFAHFDATSEYDFKAQNLVGNPYLGFRYEKDSSGGLFRVGIRFPLIKAESDKYYAMEYGMLTTFDRFEAFIPELFTMSAAGGYKYVSPGGITTRFLLGPVLFMPKDEDKELWGDYSVHLWYQYKMLTVGGGMAGRFLVASEYASYVDFGERFVNRIEFAGKVGLGRICPGLHIQIPLDSDQREDIGLSYGLDLAIAFK